MATPPISYDPINWDTTKYVNPSNMNHIDEGILTVVREANSLRYSVDYLLSNLQIEFRDDIDSMVKLLPWGGFHSCIVSNNSLLPTTDTYIVFSYDGHGVAICINNFSFGIYRGYQTRGWTKVDSGEWSGYNVLSSENPQIIYRYNTYMVEVYVNTNVNSYPSETDLATLPIEFAPTLLLREYRGNGHISIDTDGHIYANNVDPWTVANFMFPRR